MTFKKHEAAVNSDLCVGSATCIGIAPDVFELVRGVAKGRVVTTPGEVDLALEAMDACPVLAISVIPVDEQEVADE